MLPPDATEEQPQAHVEKLASYRQLPRHSYTKKQLDEEWAQYQRLYKGQRDLCRQGCGIQELQEAMTRLPKLNELRMSMENNLEIQSDYLREAFSACLIRPFGAGSRRHPPGVPQLRSILVSAQNAGVRFRTFECANVSWKLFRRSQKDLKAFAAVLSQVRRFRLELSMGIDDTGNEMGIELEECREFLRNRRFRDLISQANDIEHLDIKLEWSTLVYGVELANLVGDRIWPRLTSVVLSSIEATEDHLIQFLERHRTTLRDLHLDEIHLASGEWNSALTRIRAFLQLKSFLLEGQLSSDLPRREFDFGMLIFNSGRDPEDIPRIEKRNAIREWFKSGGDCPLTDEWSLE